MAHRIVNVNVLPGEPLDGSGKVAIHLFIEDEVGPILEPAVTCMADVEVDGNVVKQLSVRPTRGRLACNPRRTVAPTTRNGVTTVTPRSGDPRAVTCPKCIASRDYKTMMGLLSTT